MPNAIAAFFKHLFGDYNNNCTESAIAYLKTHHGNNPEELKDALREFLTFFEKEDFGGRIFWDKCLAVFPETQEVVDRLLRSETRWYDLYILSFVEQIQRIKKPSFGTRTDHRRRLEETLQLLLDKDPKNKEVREDTIYGLLYALVIEPIKFADMLPFSETLEKTMPELFGELPRFIVMSDKLLKNEKYLVYLMQEIFKNYTVIPEGGIPLLLINRGIHPSIIEPFFLAYLGTNPHPMDAKRVVQNTTIAFNYGGNRTEEEAKVFLKLMKGEWKRHYKVALPEGTIPNETDGILGYAQASRNK